MKWNEKWPGVLPTNSDRATILGSGGGRGRSVCQAVGQLATRSDSQSDSGEGSPTVGQTVIEIVRISGGQPTPAYSTTLYVSNIDAYLFQLQSDIRFFVDPSKGFLRHRWCLVALENKVRLGSKSLSDISTGPSGIDLGIWRCHIVEWCGDLEIWEVWIQTQPKISFIEIKSMPAKMLASSAV